MSRYTRESSCGSGQGSHRQPHLSLLHGSMLLSGFGTVFLGPVLPSLARSSHATDSGSGLFFTAQFLGAFLGGITTTARLWLCLLRGCCAAALGFLLLALGTRHNASSALTAAALLPLGFGVGQMLTSANLLVARRFAAGRGTALLLVNFSWSLGAMLTPFLLGLVLPRVALPHVLAGAAGLFAIAAAGTAWNRRFGANVAPAQRQLSEGVGLSKTRFLAFAASLLVYGGVETSLSGWVTTFALRYGTQHTGGALSSATLGTTALWIGIVAGRALAPLLLRTLGARRLLQVTLALAAVLTVVLSLSRGGAGISVTCVLLGLALAPWFPLVLNSMLAAGARANQTGTIIAVSGIGAAVLPLLVGTVSRAAGSLRFALVVPTLGILALLVLSGRQSQPAAVPGRPA